MKFWSSVCLLLGLLLSANAKDYTRPVEIGSLTNNEVEIMWNAIPSNTYVIKTTSDLKTGQWQTGPSEYSCSNVIGEARLDIDSPTQYFQVEKKDKEAPSIELLYPKCGAIAVSTNSLFEIVLDDQTGIDTNSIVLSVGRWTNTFSSGNFTFVSNTITFVPPASLGGLGSVVTNTLSVSDTLGHNLNYSWSFYLELEPIVNPPDFIALVAPDDPAQQLFSKGGIVMRRTIPGIEPMNSKKTYTLVSVTNDSFVFSYEGAEPSITNETLLVSYDAANPFYRRAVSNEVNMLKGEVTVWTYDVSVETLIEQFSMNSMSFESAAVPAYARMANVSMNLHNEFGSNLDGLVLFNVTNQADTASITLSLPECNWFITTDVDVDFQLRWAKLTDLDVTASCEFEENIGIELLAEYILSGDDFKTLASYSHIYGGMAGPIPIWVEIILDLNVGYEYSLGAVGDITTSYSGNIDASYNIKLENDVWSQSVDGPNINSDFTPINWSVDGSAGAKVYLQPKLTVYVYSLVGPWVDMKGYARAEGTVGLDPLSGSYALYAGISSDLGIDSRIWYDAWGGKPQWKLFAKEWSIWSKSYDYNMRFVGDLSNKMVCKGNSFYIDGEVAALVSPLYTWYYNGTKITGERSSVYDVSNATFGDQGTYTVKASAPGLQTMQTSCVVNVFSENLDIVAAHYPFNGNFNDISLSENDLQAIGVSFCNDRLGRANRAVRLNGSSSSLISSSSVIITGNLSRTISAWIKPDSLNGVFGLISWGKGDSVGQLCSLITDKSTPRFHGHNADAQPPQGVLTAGQWQHIAFVYSGTITGSMFYVDGNAVAPTDFIHSQPALETALNRPLYVGREDPSISPSGWSVPWSGCMDEVRIYGRALSAEEIQALFLLTE